MGYHPWGCKESDTTEQVTHIHTGRISQTLGYDVIDCINMQKKTLIQKRGASVKEVERKQKGYPERGLLYSRTAIFCGQAFLNVEEAVAQCHINILNFHYQNNPFTQF